MESRSFARVCASLAVVALVAAGPSFAQSTPRAEARPAAPPIAHDHVVAVAKLSLGVAQVRDSIQKQLAQPRNKTPQAQQQLRDQLATQVAEILHHADMSDEEYRRRTYVVSTD